MKKKTAIVSRLLSLSLVLLFLFYGCNENKVQPNEDAAPVFGEDSGRVSGETTGNETWAIYLYLCGSDLESDNGFATQDLEELSQVTLPPNVTVVIQTGGSYEWQSEMVDAENMYRLTYTGDQFDLVETVPNASMGEGSTFEDFLTFCTTKYPADNKGLILWDHGGGSGSGICYDQLYDNDYLTLSELKESFTSVLSGSAALPFEFIGFDACLMATVDVAAVCADYARYMIASEETEPGCGWNYKGIFSALAQNTGVSTPDLGRTICDTYYQGCVDIEDADIVTLSVIDLAKISAVQKALDALSLEAISTALSSGPSAFFADYGRGAQKADYYGDQSPEMADLVSLISENKHLFPQTADTLLSSVADSVVYQITGKYRANSNGLSAYFPYNMDANNYDNFMSASAAPAMSYMYELLLTGEFSEEAQTYLSQSQGFDGALLEDDWSFVDMSSYGLEDHKVEVVKENGITYAQLNIGTEAAQALQRVTFMLGSYLDDGETVVLLGEDAGVFCDWDKGEFYDEFIGLWGAIDGHLVMMEIVSMTDEYILYDVPILINGESYTLAVSYQFETDAYEILTATPDNGDSNIPPKERRQLKPGDKITTLFYYLEDSDEGYYENESFTFSAQSQFDKIQLDDGVYGLLFVMTDYSNNAYMSDLVGVDITDGFVEVFSMYE